MKVQINMFTYVYKRKYTITKLCKYTLKVFIDFNLYVYLWKYIPYL